MGVSFSGEPSVGWFQSKAKRKNTILWVPPSLIYVYNIYIYTYTVFCTPTPRACCICKGSQFLLLLFLAGGTMYVYIYTLVQFLGC